MRYSEAYTIARQISDNLCEQAMPLSFVDIRQEFQPKDDDPAMVECYLKYGEHLIANGRIGLDRYVEVSLSNDFACIANGGRWCPRNFTKEQINDVVNKPK